MQKKYQLLLICCCLVAHQQTSPKKKISSKKSSIHIVHASPGAGLCYEMLKTINHLAWCEKREKKMYIYWDNKSPYYLPEGFNSKRNVWEYYFYPICNLPLKKVKQLQKNKRRLMNRYNPPRASDQLQRSNWLPNNDGRLLAKKIIDSQIHLKPNVARKIEDFYNQHMIGKKTIGIHLRGTDKYKERASVDPLMILDVANAYATEGYQFFVATDEFKLLQLAQKRLHGPVICYDCFRSDDERPIHLRDRQYIYNKAQVGEDMLVEAHILSRCNLFLHTPTNVAGFVVCLNPDLQNIVITADDAH